MELERIENKLDMILEKVTVIEISAKEQSVLLANEIKAGADQEVRLRKVETKITLWTGALGVITGLTGAGFMIAVEWVKSLFRRSA